MELPKSIAIESTDLPAVRLGPILAQALSHPLATFRMATDKPELGTQLPLAFCLLERALPLSVREAGIGEFKVNLGNNPLHFVILTDAAMINQAFGRPGIDKTKDAVAGTLTKDGPDGIMGRRQVQVTLDDGRKTWVLDDQFTKLGGAMSTFINGLARKPNINYARARAVLGYEDTQDTIRMGDEDITHIFAAVVLEELFPNTNWDAEEIRKTVDLLDVNLGLGGQAFQMAILRGGTIGEYTSAETMAVHEQAQTLITNLITQELKAKQEAAKDSIPQRKMINGKIVTVTPESKFKPGLFSVLTDVAGLDYQTALNTAALFLLASYETMASAAQEVIYQLGNSPRLFVELKGLLEADEFGQNSDRIGSILDSFVISATGRITPQPIMFREARAETMVRGNDGKEYQIPVGAKLVALIGFAINGDNHFTDPMLINGIDDLENLTPEQIERYKLAWGPRPKAEEGVKFISEYCRGEKYARTFLAAFVRYLLDYDSLAVNNRERRTSITGIAHHDGLVVTLNRTLKKAK